MSQSVAVRAERVVGQQFAVPDTTPRPQPGLRGIAIVVSAVLAILADTTASAIINTGLPYLQAITEATPDEASWIITAFNAAYYALILFSPWMMARVGHRRLLILALLGFSATSLVLALTTNFALFIALRFLQGAFLGCVFVPAALLLFLSLHPKALKFAPPAFVFVSLGGSTMGTVIGGFLADAYGGNYVFLPSCVATFLTALLIAVAVKDTDRPQRDLRFDGLGLGLSIITFGTMQFLSNEGERRNWLDDSTIGIGACVLALIVPAFVVYELYVTRAPHVDFRMFARHRNLSVGALVNIAVGASGYSITLFVAYLQASIGATPTDAGALVLLRLATYAVGVPAAFLLITAGRFDIRAVVVIGALGSALGFATFANRMTTTADFGSFVGVSLLFGLFFGMMNQPLGALVIGSMPLPLLAAGVSIYKLSSPVGLMIATGGLQTLLDHQTVLFRTAIVGNIAFARAPVQRYVASHHGDPSGLTALAATQALTLSYASIMLLFALIVLVVIPVVLFAKVQKPAPPPANV